MIQNVRLQVAYFSVFFCCLFLLLLVNVEIFYMFIQKNYITLSIFSVALAMTYIQISAMQEQEHKIDIALEQEQKANHDVRQWTHAITSLTDIEAANINDND